MWEVHSEVTSGSILRSILVNSGQKLSKTGHKFSKTGLKLSKTGHKTSKTQSNGRVNLIYCRIQPQGPEPGLYSTPLGSPTVSSNRLFRPPRTPLRPTYRQCGVRGGVRAGWVYRVGNPGGYWGGLYRVPSHRSEERSPAADSDRRERAPAGRGWSEAGWV